MPTTYEYYNAVLWAIGKIAEGRTPTWAIDNANISWEMFEKLTTEDAVLAKMLAAAQQRGHDTMADLLLTLTDPRNPYFTSDPKQQKVISDNIKWLLSHRDRKRYGEQVTVQIEGTVEHVITEQLERARQRSRQAIEERETIDADYIEVQRSLPPPPPPPPSKVS
jgi:hypothetical protein